MLNSGSKMAKQQIVTLKIQRHPGEIHGDYRIIKAASNFNLERRDGAIWVAEDLSTWIDQPSLQGVLQAFMQGFNALPLQDGFYVGRFDLLPDGRCGLQMSEELTRRVDAAQTKRLARN